MVCSPSYRCQLSPTLKEGAFLSETLKTAFQALQYHIPEDCYLGMLSLENYNSGFATSRDIPTFRWNNKRHEKSKRFSLSASHGTVQHTTFEHSTPEWELDTAEWQVRPFLKKKWGLLGHLQCIIFACSWWSMASQSKCWFTSCVIEECLIQDLTEWNHDLERHGTQDE